MTFLNGSRGRVEEGGKSLLDDRIALAGGFLHSGPILDLAQATDKTRDNWNSARLTLVPASKWAATYALLALRELIR
jgi:hypothetical protein